MFSRFFLDRVNTHMHIHIIYVYLNVFESGVVVVFVKLHESAPW